MEAEGTLCRFDGRGLAVQGGDPESSESPRKTSNDTMVKIATFVDINAL